MRSIVKTVLLAGVLCITKNLKAQVKDYVITNNGDTVSCNVRGPSLFGVYKYNTGQNDKSVKIKPQEIKEFCKAGSKVAMRAVFIEGYNKPVFMTILERGKISLYEMIVTTTYSSSTMTNTTSSTKWYASKGSDTVTLLKNGGVYLLSGRQKHKGEFAEMLKDNKELHDKYIADDKFSFSQVQNLVHLYNTGQPYKKD